MKDRFYAFGFIIILAVMACGCARGPTKLTELSDKLRAVILADYGLDIPKGAELIAGEYDNTVRDNFIRLEFEFDASAASGAEPGMDAEQIIELITDGSYLCSRSSDDGEDEDSSDDGFAARWARENEVFSYFLTSDIVDGHIRVYLEGFNPNLGSIPR